MTGGGAPISDFDVAEHDAERFLSVIDHVLELNYLKPSLRLRVIELRRRMARNMLAAHDEPAVGVPGRQPEGGSAR